MSDILSTGRFDLNRIKFGELIRKMQACKASPWQACLPKRGFFHKEKMTATHSERIDVIISDLQLSVV